jgi:hypothetical protein
MISALFLISGLLLDFKSFLGNTLSELAGIALSALLAVLIFERLAERERWLRWQRARHQLFAALSDQLASIGFEVYITLPVEVRESGSADVATGLTVGEPELISVFIELRNMVYDNLNMLAEADDGCKETATLYEAVRPNLGRIHDALLLQFLQLGRDPDLVADISRLESATRQWEWNLRMSRFATNGPSTWDSVVVVLDSALAILKRIHD